MSPRQAIVLSSVETKLKQLDYARVLSPLESLEHIPINVIVFKHSQGLQNYPKREIITCGSENVINACNCGTPIPVPLAIAQTEPINHGNHGIKDPDLKQEITIT